jgi:hypothetical protein
MASLRPGDWMPSQSPAAWGCALILFASAACTASGEITPARSEPPKPPSTTTYRATETSTPFTQVTPGIIYEGGVFQPEPSPTTVPVVLPPEELLILEPGDRSHVASPFQVRGYLRSGGHSQVHIRLLDERGEPVVDRDARLRPIGDQPYFFIVDLEFEIPQVAEAARLEVSTADPAGGQIDHLTSVRLILLSIGPGEIHPVIEGPERLTILEPLPGSHLTSSTFSVRGTAWTDSWTPLSIRLFAANGELIREGNAELRAPGLGQLGLYETQLTLRLTAPTDAHLLVCEMTPVLLLPVHCASAPLFLAP